MASDDVHVRLDGVTRVFQPTEGGRAVHALGPIDLAVRRGEFLSIVGPSGCGKSTLIDLMAGLGSATDGSIEFEGQCVRGEPPEGIGVVFQQDASFPWLDVAHNIGFGLARRHVAKDVIAAKVQQAIRLMGLQGFADAYPAELSGGMRQRVCIARTLVLAPRLILLDEPFAALDSQTRLLMGDELLTLWRATGATVVLITHSLEEAVLLADRVVVMSARPGRVLDVIDTGWPTDRSSVMLTDARFAALTARIWTTLRQESLAAMGRRVEG